MSNYKKYSDKAKYMDFMIKDEKSFDKYTTIWGKVSNKIKTNFNLELIYNKFYQKVKKKIQHTKKLSMFICTSNIH